MSSPEVQNVILASPVKWRPRKQLQRKMVESVREDRMPHDEFGREKPLAPAMKSALLNEGAAFERVLDLAKQWEAANPVSVSRAP